VFVRSGSSWSQEAKLEASDGAGGDLFGFSVSLSADGSRALIGAPRGDTPRGVDAGSAYVFVRSDSSWSEEAKLEASDGAEGGLFGFSVSLSGDGSRALIGAYGDDTPGGADAGSAYVFVRSGSTWSQQAKLEASDGAEGDWFGWSVSLSGDGNWAVIGAYLDDTPRGTDAGSAYVFGLVKTNGEPCSMGSECLSGYCVDGVCCDSPCGGGSTSDCQACSRSAGASGDGTCGFVRGGTTCRPPAGPCDVAETCSGTSATCPPDGFVSAGTVCRPAMGDCDVAETCSGTRAECPDDAFASAGTVCRAGGDACDPAETCYGTSPTCPEDVTMCDAGMMAGADAGTGTDGGTTELDGGAGDAGLVPRRRTSCFCRVPWSGAEGDGGPAALAVLGWLFATFFRRRRRGRGQRAEVSSNGRGRVAG
jgi:hypothetical protein